ncbi:hypothetical protein HJG60_011815 [Phyllostomus discolor]|uniref:Uncharacterized protein n=1 Tax=Phyllostomus discolor TaxID=89673 RepID=A0A834DSQ6_9CHIR|nr:hypothetical protein HJG60_011815 [Phyllostomus discolor]
MLGDLKEEGFAGACPQECSEDLPEAFSGTAKEQALLALEQTELWDSQGSPVLLDSDPRDTNAEEPTEGSRDPGSDRGLGCPPKQKCNRQVQLGQECGHGPKLKKDTSVSYEPSECKISFRCEEQLATYLRTRSGWESLSASELEDSLRRRPQLKPQSKRTNSISGRSPAAARGRGLADAFTSRRCSPELGRLRAGSTATALVVAPLAAGGWTESQVLS